MTWLTRCPEYLTEAPADLLMPLAGMFLAQMLITVTSILMLSTTFDSPRWQRPIMAAALFMITTQTLYLFTSFYVWSYAGVYLQLRHVLQLASVGAGLAIMVAILDLIMRVADGGMTWRDLLGHISAPESAG